MQVSKRGGAFAAGMEVEILFFCKGKSVGKKKIAANSPVPNFFVGIRRQRKFGSRPNNGIY
ncbi:hypothetical protein ACM44_12465 [Chryseobacterium koreense CCUG 49689]|uniref:Uncharacterized protein n=1 Tax=Chryseobacterium koreense CCUG 49689 TaxID=1304281 RepID=A0A0J7IX18_9FLAO|nr:hypothetical protein ACM44_12465 [Chryseobacterium koreense CCUG 49689]